MKIAIDARMLQYSRVGISVYVENLILNLVKNFENIELHLIFVKKLKTLNLFDKYKNIISYYVAPGYGEYFKRELWEFKNLATFLDSIDVDLYHSPNYYLPYLVKPKVPMVVTMYDASLFAVPQYYKFFHKFLGKIHIYFSSKVATRFIFGSAHAKSEFIKYLGKDIENKGTYIYIGLPNEINNKKMIKNESIILSKEKYKINGKYIIAIGSVHPRKNYERLIEAMSDERLQDYTLVICGSIAWKSDSVFEKIKKLNLENRVIITNYIETEDMQNLLTGAELMVYPSFYEGFGIPPLEAFAYNIPVVTSNTSSIPEVVCDAAVLFDPFDVKDMSDKIIGVLNSNDLKTDLIAKGKERLNFFSWDKCAKEHMNVYLEALKEKRGK